jgi:tetratricopeptide (TPR) repeat protein
MSICPFRLRRFRDRKLFLAIPAIFAISLPMTRLLLAQGSTPGQAGSVQASVVAAKSPETALPPEQLGDLQMVRKQYQAALEQYGKIWPKSAQVWNKIGIASQQLFNAEEARKSYENALKLDPKNPDVLNNLGSVYYSAKQYSAAERMYRKALKLKPKSPLIYKNLGTAYLAANNFKKGWECYQAALTLDPETFERQSQLRVGEPTPALQRGAMNFYLAKSYVRAGMSDRAIEYLRMAIDEGFTDRKKVLEDKEFASLHGLTAFQQLISEQTMQ